MFVSEYIDVLTEHCKGCIVGEQLNYPVVA